MRILVIGAGGHIGTAVVSALRPRHHVVAASRSTQPAVDATDTSSLEALFATVGTVDALVATMGSVPFAPLADLTREDYASAFTGKVLSQVDVVRLGASSLADGGSITLTTGILAREPIAAGAAAALANGALESFVITAATQLPRGIRLNAVSPTVLAEATGYHSSFPGFVPVPASIVAQAYVKSIEGVQTGCIFAVQ